MNNQRRPSLSVIVPIVSDTIAARPDTTHLNGTLAALAAQTGVPAFEVIAPYLPQTAGIEEAKRRFPDVRFVPVYDLETRIGEGYTREHHDELRSRAIAHARSEIVALIEDHGRPGPDWAARMLEMHRRGYAGVGGAIENAVDRPLNWAVYFCDFGRYQNPLPEGDSAMASDANVSYKREALERIRLAWEGRFQEPVVNGALFALGEKIGMAPRAVLYQYRLSLTLAGALTERYVWGRSYAASRCAVIPRSRQLLLAALSPVIPGAMMARMALAVIRKRRRIVEFALASPITLLLTTSWAWGEFRGYLAGAGVPAGVRNRAGAGVGTR